MAAAETRKGDYILLKKNYEGAWFTAIFHSRHIFHDTLHFTSYIMKMRVENIAVVVFDSVLHQ